MELKLENFNQAKTRIKYIHQDGSEKELADRCVIYPHPDIRGWYVAVSEETSTVGKGQGIRGAYTRLIGAIARTIQYMFTHAPGTILEAHSECEYFNPDISQKISHLNKRLQKSWLEKLLSELKQSTDKLKIRGKIIIGPLK